MFKSAPYIEWDPDTTLVSDHNFLDSDSSDDRSGAIMESDNENED